MRIGMHSIDSQAIGCRCELYYVLANDNSRKRVRASTSGPELVA